MDRKEGTRFRRDVVTELRAARQWLLHSVDDWDVKSTVFVPATERVEQGLEPQEYLRPRRPEEYPEVSEDELARLMSRLQRVRDDLEAVQARAARRYRQLQAERHKQAS